MKWLPGCGARQEELFEAAFDDGEDEDEDAGVKEKGPKGLAAIAARQIKTKAWPSPATHASSTVLKAGERVFQTFC